MIMITAISKVEDNPDPSYYMMSYGKSELREPDVPGITRKRSIEDTVEAESREIEKSQSSSDNGQESRQAQA